MIGLLSGVAITLLVARAAAAFLYGVTPFDIEIYGLAGSVMSAAALFAHGSQRGVRAGSIRRMRFGRSE